MGDNKRCKKKRRINDNGKDDEHKIWGEYKLVVNFMKHDTAKKSACVLTLTY